jgi:hypothetical protein
MAALTTIALVGLAAVGTAQAYEANQQNKKAEEAQRKANAISTAEGQVQDINARRQRVREARIRRAQIEQAAVNTGVAGGSGEAGALSSVGTNLAASNAASRGSQQTALSISNFNQVASRARSRAGEASAISGLAFQGASLAAPSIGSGGTK